MLQDLHIFYIHFLLMVLTLIYNLSIKKIRAEKLFWNFHNIMIERIFLVKLIGLNMAQLSHPTQHKGDHYVTL